MKKTVLSVVSMFLMLIMMFSLVSCSSLPSAVKDKKIEKAQSFLELNPSDEEITSMINKATASWMLALGNDDDVVTGYSKQDKAIYTIYYTNFSSMDMSSYGVDQSEIIPSVKGISEKITKSVDFGSYKYGVIVVKGYKSSSYSADVLFVLMNNKEVANYTSWKK